jgi:hypothetical protein
MPTAQVGPDRHALRTARFLTMSGARIRPLSALVVDPCSASRRRAALRSPWATRCGGRPACFTDASIKALRPLSRRPRASATFCVDGACLSWFGRHLRPQRTNAGFTFLRTERFQSGRRATMHRSYPMQIIYRKVGFSEARKI